MFDAELMELGLVVAQGDEGGLAVHEASIEEGWVKGNSLAPGRRAW